jgi:hypothetical protein
VPAPSTRAAGANPLGIAGSLALSLAGAAVLVRGRRPSTGPRSGSKMEKAAP